jgi:hypothetical protein
MIFGSIKEALDSTQTTTAQSKINSRAKFRDYNPNPVN